MLRTELDVIPALRELGPNRRLNWREAWSVAERQAIRLLELTAVTEPPVHSFIITALPGISVDYADEWPTAGGAIEHYGGWRIVIRASDPPARKRFTLFHEFKHVIDDRQVDRMLYDSPGGRTAGEKAETICNYFAACALMPRRWIKRDWGHGIQSLEELTRRYCVSEEAMVYRLHDLGLWEAIPRVQP